MPNIQIYSLSNLLKMKHTGAVKTRKVLYIHRVGGASMIYFLFFFFLYFLILPQNSTYVNREIRYNILLQNN